ncbi:MAG TPA: substrate-binding domain-containing protein [Bacteroidia bacterium]|nr:substrate-binding domain-containing protein [Bacteroidia bacterium]
MRGLVLVFISILIIGILGSCNRDKVPEKDTPTAGIITIAVDSSLKDLIDQQVFVFNSLYKYATVLTEYNPGEVAYSRLRSDSIRMVIGYREADPADSAWFLNIKIHPRTHMIGADAMVLVCNKLCSDSVLTLDQLRERFLTDSSTSKLTPKRKLLFDNPKSSIPKLFLEKLGITNIHPSNSFAFQNVHDVIDYISSDTMAIGVIPYSSLLSDTTLPGPNAKVLGVADSTGGAGVVPTFKTLSKRTYPLILGIYILSREARSGLGTGFTAFVNSDKGQRIILREGLAPADMPPHPVNIYGN